MVMKGLLLLLALMLLVLLVLVLVLVVLLLTFLGEGRMRKRGTRGIWVLSCPWRGPWAPKVRLCD